MSQPFYVTTAIAYPNGAPHVGHAYEYIATDAIARFKRLDGFDVRFLTGTDEHGLKMAQTAAAEGIPTAEFARRNSDEFERLQEMLNISFDRFIRTTDPDHYAASTRDLGADGRARRHLSRQLLRLVLGARRAVLHRGRDTVDAEGVRVATETGTPVTWTEEQTYFFRLSAYAERTAGALRRPPGVHRAGGPPQRGGQLRLRRSARPVDIADLVRLGGSGARRPRRT